MTLFRANDRHPKDDRILIIRNMDEFQLWRERSQHGIHGIICTEPPAPLPALTEAAEHLAMLSRKTKSRPFQDVDRAKYPGAKQAFIAISPAERVWERKAMDQLMLDQTTRDVITVLSGHFGLATTIHAGYPRDCGAVIRVNDYSVSNFHTHPGAFLNISFSMAGMVCKAPDGSTHQLAPGESMLFDESIEHKSPEKDPEWKKNPRASLVLQQG